MQRFGILANYKSSNLGKDNKNKIVIAAGFGLAALVLASTGDKKSTPPKVYAPKITGGSVEFIKKMYPVALAAQKQYPKIPWQLFLTFSGLESGFGKSAPEWNFFGTKPGKAWKGKTQLLTTTEVLPKKTGYNFPEVISVTPSTKYPGKYTWKVKDRFRAYNSPLEAFLDFGAFISKGCYAKAANLPYINQKLQQIKDCGYATDPGYVAKQLKMVSLVQETVNKLLK